MNQDYEKNIVPVDSFLNNTIPTSVHRTLKEFDWVYKFEKIDVYLYPIISLLALINYFLVIYTFRNKSYVSIITKRVFLASISVITIIALDFITKYYFKLSNVEVYSKLPFSPKNVFISASIIKFIVVPCNLLIIELPDSPERAIHIIMKILSSIVLIYQFFLISIIIKFTMYNIKSHFDNANSSRVVSI